MKPEDRIRIYVPPRTRGKIPRRYRFGPNEEPVKDWKVVLLITFLAATWLFAWWLFRRLP